MGILKEFKEFALKGSVIDLAVGLVIGAAFNAIVNSAVTDLFTPVLGWIAGKNLDFSNWYLPLSSDVPHALPLAEAQTKGAVLAWGKFVTVTLNFIIVSACIFLVVKGINRLRRASAPPPSRQEVLLGEIRDLLKK